MYTGTVRKRIGRRQAFPQGYGTVYDGKWKSNAMGERGVLTPTASLQGDITGGTIVYDEFRDNARCERGVKTWPGA